MNYFAPGVYIRYVTEGPLSVRGVSTSTAVFVGPTVIGNSISGTTVTPTLVTSASEYAEAFATTGARFGAVSLPPSGGAATVDAMGHAVRGFFLNGGSKAYIVSTSTGTAAVASTVLELSGGAAATYEIQAVSAGAWGNAITVEASTSAIGAGFVDLVITLTLAGDDGDVTLTETFIGRANGDLGSIASNIVTIATTGDAADLSVDTATPADSASGSLSGGANSNGSTSSDFDAIFSALRDFDDISLIVLPGLFWDADRATYERGIAHAQLLKDRMVLVQIADTAVDADANYFNSVSIPVDKYVAAYHPQGVVVMAVPGRGRLSQTVSLTGHVAGIFARTDQERGPWTAPAGLHASVRGIERLTKSISQIKQEAINTVNVNAMRYIDGLPVVWGARTRDVNGLYQYIPVFRTAILIADSLRAALNTAVFAKNTETLWKNVKAGVTGFMDALYQQGAFQGATPGEAFEVAVGLNESMTQAEIETGLLRVTVRFKAAVPAEFIEVTIERIIDTVS